MEGSDRTLIPKKLIPKTEDLLPIKLWNWDVPNNISPIPITYPVKYYFNLEKIEEWRNIIARLSSVDHDLNNFSVSDLKKLFDLYNIYFFNNSLPKTTLEISNGLTKVAGKCKISGTVLKCEYTIIMSRKIFTGLILEKNQGTKSGGVVCKTRLNCLQLVLEHEIIHLIIRHNYQSTKNLDKKIYSSHGLLFKSLVKNYFGQTESTHQIGNIIYEEDEEEKFLRRDDIKICKMVSFLSKGILKKGIVVNILIKNVGVRFIDGDNWKINFDFLHKITENDDDYDVLLDLQNEIKSKLILYKTIKIGDIVKFEKTKNEIISGVVVKINQKSNKLSISSDIFIYTTIYTQLVENKSFGISGVATVNMSKNFGDYTIYDFKIGDKVIIKGGPRSQDTFGTIIKLNRVNAKIKETNNTIWTAPYTILKFQ